MSEASRAIAGAGRITPLEFEKAEWSRMAQAAYGRDRNDLGHFLSAAASLPKGGSMTLRRFDDLQGMYRAWLVANELPGAGWREE